jgi:hypothetical protein
MPISAEAHGGVELRKKLEGEPDIAVAPEGIPLSVSNTGFELGFGTPTGCPGACIDVALDKPAPPPIPQTPLPNTVGTPGNTGWPH